MVVPLLVGIHLALMKIQISFLQERHMLKHSAVFFLFVLLLTRTGSAWEGPRSPSLFYFPHSQHQKKLGGCTECHGEKGPGPIPQLGEKWAHDTCKGCHTKKHSGPVDCIGCHAQM